MLKVFLVEDEIIMREGIRNIIEWEKEGLEFCGEASDGELAYPLIKKLQPDILITDIKMPFMDGLELSRIVKKELPGIKIIILSGHDDFDYAKEAIGIGVTDYLLKPISSMKLLEAIKRVAESIEKEREQESIIKKYQEEMNENTEHEMRELFRELTNREVPVTEALEKGERLGIDLSAGAYNILLFRISCEEEDKVYSERLLKAADLAGQIAGQSSEILLFKRDAQELAFLLKGADEAQVKQQGEDLENHFEAIQKEDQGINYFGGLGKIVFRLRDLKTSYVEANRAYALRFFSEKNQIVQYDQVRSFLTYEQTEFDMSALNAGKLDRRVMEGFLKNGTSEEAKDFIEEYFISLGQNNVKSLMFRQYIVMDIYFCSVSFLDDLGIDAERVNEKCGDLKRISEVISSMDMTVVYLENLLRQVIGFRETTAAQKYTGLLREAKDYIQENFDKEEISLNLVASVVNMSPSYFSSVFRQETGRTFIEYLTSVRIDKAKELLMCTNLKNSEIGFNVGYKDPHYFSYIFKKTQGCTPKEYRMRGKERK